MADYVPALIAGLVAVGLDLVIPGISWAQVGGCILLGIAVGLIVAEGK